MVSVMERMAPVTHAASRARTRMQRRINHLREDLADDAADLLALMRETQQLWSHVCRMVVKDQTEEAHLGRDSLRKTVDESLVAIREWLRVVHQVAGVGNGALVQTQEVARAAEEVDRFWQRLFDRWKSPEDLEDLVANATAPTREQLEAITQKYGFPHAWQAAEDSPV